MRKPPRPADELGFPAAWWRWLGRHRPPGWPSERVWRSPLRGPWLTAVLGAVLLVTLPVVTLTGLLSFVAYGDGARPSSVGLLHLPAFAWPTSPSWLYRLNQGLHVGLGLVLIPVVLAKLWSVIPRLFIWPPARSAAQVLERLSLGLLVGSILFELATGVLEHPVRLRLRVLVLHRSLPGRLGVRLRLRRARLPQAPADGPLPAFALLPSELRTPLARRPWRPGPTATWSRSPRRPPPSAVAVPWPSSVGALCSSAPSPQARRSAGCCATCPCSACARTWIQRGPQRIPGQPHGSCRRDHRRRRGRRLGVDPDRPIRIRAAGPQPAAGHGDAHGRTAHRLCRGLVHHPGVDRGPAARPRRKGRRPRPGVRGRVLLGTTRQLQHRPLQTQPGLDRDSLLALGSTASTSPSTMASRRVSSCPPFPGCTTPSGWPPSSSSLHDTPVPADSCWPSRQSQRLLACATGAPGGPATRGPCRAHRDSGPLEAPGRPAGEAPSATASQAGTAPTRRTWSPSSSPSRSRGMSCRSWSGLRTSRGSGSGSSRPSSSTISSCSRSTRWPIAACRPAVRPRGGPLVVPVVNHLRLPALASGILLLIFFPAILQQGEATYLRASGLREGTDYLHSWLLLTAAFFVVSATAYAARRRLAAPPRLGPSDRGGQRSGLSVDRRE